MKMRFSRTVAAAVAVSIGALVGYGCSKPTEPDDANVTVSDAPAAEKVQRFGSVIGLKAEKRDEYNELHANCWPEVLAMIKKCNIRNYSIYQAEIDGKWYLFSYFEYTGTDFDADMKLMEDDPKTNEWWVLTDPCQVRLEGTPEGDQWMSMPEVFHTD